MKKRSPSGKTQEFDWETGDENATRLLQSRAIVHCFEEAALDPAVIEFRGGLPDGKLVSRNRAYFWAMEVFEKEGATLLKGERFAGLSAEDEYQLKVVPDDKELILPLFPRFEIPALADGTLGRLLSIATRLSNQYGWNVAGAATWIVTGRFEGLISPIQQDRLMGPPRARPAVWNRIEMRIPAEYPPSYVAEVYRDMRSRIATEQPTLTIKGAPIREKQLSAMTFCAGRNDGRSWNAMLEEWTKRNAKENPDWAYASFRNFARDVRETYQRVMGRPWQHGRMGDKNDGEA